METPSLKIIARMVDDLGIKSADDMSKLVYSNPDAAKLLNGLIKHSPEVRTNPLYQKYSHPQTTALTIANPQGMIPYETPVKNPLYGEDGKDYNKNNNERDGQMPYEGAGEAIDNRPYLDPKSRPSFRKGLVEAVWDRAKGIDGLVRDPNTNDVIDWIPGQTRQGVWDMGHIADQKYRKVHQEYLQGKMTPKQFRDWYNDFENYRPELPHNNRGHLFE